MFFIELGRKKMESLTEIGIIAKAASVEKREIFNIMPVDVVAFVYDRSAAERIQIDIHVLHLEGRPHGVNWSNWLPKQRVELAVERMDSNSLAWIFVSVRFDEHS